MSNFSTSAAKNPTEKTLVLGGVKSGKSRFAESLVQQRFDSLVEGADTPPTIAVIATAQALDDEMKKRIARHQDDRPAAWQTYEEPLYLAKQVRALIDADVILIDCLTLWLTNLLMCDDDEMMRTEVDDFLSAVKDCSQPMVMVSNETNMGIVPMGDLSRRYCDEAGLLHQKLASLCDRVELIVAGLPLNLKPGA